MGNATSKSAEVAPDITVPDTMSEQPAGIIDIMATYFITSQQSKDNNLSDANYCNNLVEWLSNIIHDSQATRAGSCWKKRNAVIQIYLRVPCNSTFICHITTTSPHT